MKKVVIALIAIVLAGLVVSCSGDVTPTAKTGPFSIGSKSYSTLQEAVDSLKGKAVSDDHIIRLTQNASGSGAVISGIASEMKIDFGSYTYTLTGSSQGIVVEGNNNDVHISGGKIEMGTGNSFSSVITTKGSASISGTTIDVSEFDLDAVTTTSGTLRILGSTSITAKEDRNALAVSGNGKMKSESENVKITGGLSAKGSSEMSLDKGDFKLGTLTSEETAKLYKTENVKIEAIDETHQEDLTSLNGKAKNHFAIWVPSASALPSSSLSSKGLTNMIEVGNVFDTGNDAFDLHYAEAVMQCMPFFSKLEEVNLVTGATSVDDLKSSLQYSLYGFTIVPDVEKTAINEDGIYVYCNAYEGNGLDKTDPIGIVEYYYNYKESKLTYRQYVMLTIDVMTVNNTHIMNNGVLVYCLDDVTVEADGTLAVNQIKEDGSFETKEAYTDYLWLGDNLNLSWYNQNVHGNVSDFIAEYCYKAGFERRVITFKNNNGVTAAFSQPWATFATTKAHWVDIEENDSIKTLMKSIVDDCIITESNKEDFDGETAIAFAKLLYSNGDSIAKGGWTEYEDFAAVSLLDLKITEHEWLNQGEVENSTFWMSFFDSDNATLGDKTKRAYYDYAIVDVHPSGAVYSIGEDTYKTYGFSNLFGAYNGSDTSKRAITEFVLTKFLPYCTTASESQIKDFVTKNMVCFEEEDPFHVHTYSDKWESDEDHHWQSAICHPDVKTNYSEHSWVITERISEIEWNSTCSICGRESTTKLSPWIITDDGIVTAKSHFIAGNLIKGEVIIPDEVDGITVKGIRAGALANCTGVTSIEIPNTVTSIGVSAFSGCSKLTEITIPNSVTSIGNTAFEGCSSLKKIVIPDSVTSIGDSAFRSCSSLTDVTLPDCITSIGEEEFMDCYSLKKITIPSSLESIGQNAFRGCSSLEEITIPDTVTSIGSSAFRGCSNLTEINIPNSVTSIGNSVFYSCGKLTEITIPNHITSIGSNAFYVCSNLTSVTIGNSVTSIGESAFGLCKKLNSITFNGTIEQWNSITKASDWAYLVPVTQITCSDGVISK